MIKNRPKQHFNRLGYDHLLPGPYSIAYDAIPDLIKMSLLVVDGVQPLTLGRCEAAEGLTSDVLSTEEVEYYRRKQSRFQLVMIVVNCVRADDQSNKPVLVPYSMSLIPSSKRNQITESQIDFVAQFSGGELMGGETAYVGMDPFTGDWQMWGRLDILMGDRPRPGFMDEVGLVYGRYFLEVDHDPSEVAMFYPDLDQSIRPRYAKHLAKLLFRPFKEVRSRRIWGLETALELFAFQEIIYRGLPRPTPQVMIMEDGSVFPCLYDAWNFFGLEGAPGLISEADFLFPDQKIVVFCDGAQHARLRNRERDARIDQKLADLGYRTIRLASKRILRDIIGAVDEIEVMLLDGANPIPSLAQR